VSRIVSTRVNKFLMNMYKWLLWSPLPTSNRGPRRKSAVFLGKSYNTRENERERERERENAREREETVSARVSVKRLYAIMRTPRRRSATRSMYLREFLSLQRSDYSREFLFNENKNNTISLIQWKR